MSHTILLNGTLQSMNWFELLQHTNTVQQQQQQQYSGVPPPQQLSYTAINNQYVSLYDIISHIDVLNQFNSNNGLYNDIVHGKDNILYRHNGNISYILLSHNIWIIYSTCHNMIVLVYNCDYRDRNHPQAGIDAITDPSIQPLHDMVLQYHTHSINTCVYNIINLYTVLYIDSIVGYVNKTVVVGHSTDTDNSHNTSMLVSMINQLYQCKSMLSCIYHVLHHCDTVDTNNNNNSVLTDYDLYTAELDSLISQLYILYESSTTVDSLLQSKNSELIYESVVYTLWFLSISLPVNLLLSLFGMNIYVPFQSGGMWHFKH